MFITDSFGYTLYILYSWEAYIQSALFVLPALVKATEVSIVANTGKYCEKTERDGEVNKVCNLWSEPSVWKLDILALNYAVFLFLL